VLTADPGRSSYVSEPGRDRISGAWMILLSRVVIGSDGHVLGFVDVLIDLAMLEQFYARMSASDGPQDGVDPDTLLKNADLRCIARRRTGAVSAGCSRSTWMQRCRRGGQWHAICARRSAAESWSCTPRR
jgi:hypothetical protein